MGSACYLYRQVEVGYYAAGAQTTLPAGSFQMSSVLQEVARDRTLSDISSRIREEVHVQGWLWACWAW